MATHLESKVGAVKLDLPSDEGTEETSLLGLPGVNLDNLLLETPSDEVVTGQPDVLRGGESLERTLVLVRLLELLPVGDIVDRALDSLDNDGRSGETGLLLLLGEDSVGLGELFEILSGLVSLEEVLEGGESEVVVDVVESWGWETVQYGTRGTTTSDSPCWATYPMTKLGCFQTSPPLLGSASPTRSLTRVDFPDPLGPRTATRDESETWREMS